MSASSTPPPESSFWPSAKASEEGPGHQMLHLWVDSVDDWYAYLKAKGLEERYEGVKLAEPKVMPWGLRICFVWDPAGVLLHIAEPHPKPQGHLQTGFRKPGTRFSRAPVPVIHAKRASPMIFDSDRQGRLRRRARPPRARARVRAVRAAHCAMLAPESARAKAGCS